MFKYDLSYHIILTHTGKNYIRIKHAKKVLSDLGVNHDPTREQFIWLQIPKGMIGSNPITQAKACVKLFAL